MKNEFKIDIDAQDQNVDSANKNYYGNLYSRNSESNMKSYLLNEKDRVKDRDKDKDKVKEISEFNSGKINDNNNISRQSAKKEIKEFNYEDEYKKENEEDYPNDEDEGKFFKLLLL